MCVVLFSLALPKMGNASPGAHGPNGEHLDTSNSVLASVNPKFESFTESFELLGELFKTQLVIYLHDFKTNAPLEGADIELESGELSASAEYSDTLRAYVLTEQKMLELLSVEGEHEIVLTVMTQDNGDLLVANLSTTKTHTDDEHHDDDHHHIPWFEIFIALLVFITGFLFGRFNKEKKS
ncbi:MAG: hypothetical protein Alis3KO_07890 [Aliiglaciecola sp.]